jgi:hypothetical protein
VSNAQLDSSVQLAKVGNTALSISPILELMFVVVCDTECPTGCNECDDGTSGTGACLSPTIQNSTSSCNCLFGTCDPSGSGICICNPGWTTDKSANTTQCSVCADGFFNSGDGQCQVCGKGCAACSSGSGACIACESGLAPVQSDPTRCTPTCTAGGASGLSFCPQYVDPARSDFVI